MPALSAADNFTSTGGGGGAPGGVPIPSGGGGAGGFGTSAGIKGRQAYFVHNYQDKLNAALAQASQLAKTDPESARSLLLTAWNDFLNGASSFANEPGLAGQLNEQVVRAAMSTTSLTQTIDALWNEVGGPSNGPKSLTQTTDGSGGTLSNLKVLLPSLIALVTTAVGTKTGKPPAEPTPYPPPIEPPGTTPGTGTVGGLPPSASPTPPPITASPAGSTALPASIPQSLLKELLPYLPLIGSVFSNIYGAVTTSNASKEAAAAQLAAAQQSTELNRQIYNKTLQNQTPQLMTGAKASYRLSDLMGLTPSPQVMPNTEPIGPITLGSAAPTPSPAPVANTIPDFRSMAAKYQRSPA